MTATLAQAVRLNSVRALASALCGILLWALVVCTASAAKNDTLLVSRASGPHGKGGVGDSSEPSISADGRFIAFMSTAVNLDPDDRGEPGTFYNVFVRDIVDNKTTLVDRASGAKGRLADYPALDPAISADGRYVAFDTIASNLVSGMDPENDTSHIYVRDLKTKRTKLVSRASGSGGALANGDSKSASISGDGRYIAFLSRATNLDPQDGDQIEDVYVRDLRSNTTSLVTRPVLGGPKRPLSMSEPTISADGRFVAFTTDRSNLSQYATEGRSVVLVRDLRAAGFELVSRASGLAGAPANDGSGGASMSADGRFVSFSSNATNLAVHDDKRYKDGFVRDRQLGTTTLVTDVPRAPGSGDAAADSSVESISDDGRYAAFMSSAPGFVPNGENLDQSGYPKVHVHLRDLATATTTLVTRASGAAGALANDDAADSSVSASGRYVAFSSFATNLHPAAVAAVVDEDHEDAGSWQDVYVRDVLGPPPYAGCPLKGHIITGTGQADVLNGTSRTDLIIGRGGNDTLRGRGGRDCMYGEAGRDRLLGQSATDRLFGGSGADRLSGGRGSDRIRGQSGADRLGGGPGKDRLRGGDGPDRLKGDRGNDRLQGDRGNDRLSDHSGRDRLSGGAGNDRIDARDPTRGGRARRDSVTCGKGSHDVALVDRADRVATDCERVRTR